MTYSLSNQKQSMTEIKHTNKTKIPFLKNSQVVQKKRD